jgi:hypothetical protein
MKESFGKPSPRFEDNINMDLKGRGLECVWNEFIWLRMYMWDLMNTVIDFLF